MFFRKKPPLPREPRKEPVLGSARKTVLTITEDDAREIDRVTRPRPQPRTFTPYKPIAGVVRDGAPLAMDAAPQMNLSAAMNNMVAEGVAFMGYPRLAEMAQRVEYRHIATVLAEEATREWIGFRSGGDGDKKDRIAALEKEFTRLNVRDKFQRLSELDSYFGLGQLFIDTGIPSLDADLATPLLLTPETLQVGGLKDLVVIEPVWVSPNEYNSTKPLQADFYKPSRWWVMGSEVHSTRLLRFVSREPGQMLLPSYNFGGLPLIQLAKPYVDNWVRTRQSVSDLINGCSIVNLKTDMAATFSNSGITGLIGRIQSFIRFRDNRGVFLTDKETEELQILSANLAGLDKLQNQALEQICVVAQMPLVKFSGISPSGLNASSEGEIRVWYDRVTAYQEAFYRPNLTPVMHACMLNLWGEIDHDIEFFFVPLWQMDAAAKAAVAKTNADTRAVYVEIGAADQDEVRKALANDEDSPFSGVDMSGPGYPPLEEEEGGGSVTGGVQTFSNPAAHLDDEEA